MRKHVPPGVDRLRTEFLGRVSYRRAVQIQADAVAARADGRIADTIFLLEHEPVVTVGRASGARLTLRQRRALVDRGVEITSSDRGGGATYHGPGQLVAYLILSLRERHNDAHSYLRSLELLIIEWLASHGVAAGVEPGLTGVWTDLGKIASIGIGVRRGVAYHGFAVNLAPDLSVFQLFDPCGLNGSRVTSVRRETGVAPSLAGSAGSILPFVEEILGVHDSVSSLGGIAAGV